ncbi:hypothetical protein LTR08_001065 [Meristemomyces frigidus]|nr:hypothetical protein LTR08_001065 [Meristemomyces frigidus]
MARITQEFRHGDYGGPITHKARFKDHAGKQAIRMRRSLPSQPLPDNFRQNPVFCFQIYTTVPVGVDSGIDVVEYLLQYLGMLERWNEHCPNPAFEVYSPQTDILACVEHQRREIAQRKAHRTDDATYLIPMLRANSNPGGFIIIITFDSFTAAHMRCDDDLGGTGLVFARFDRRFPSATSVGPEQRLRHPTSQLNEGAVYPEKMEIEVEPQQDLWTMQSNLKRSYFLNYCFNDDEPSTWTALALDVDEGGLDNIQKMTVACTLDTAIDHLSLSAMKVAKHGICFSTHGIEGEPDLRYVVYVPFLHHDNVRQTLEEIARSFTSAVMLRLDPGKTVTFAFRIPPQPTMSSILADCRQYLQSKPDDYIGALTSFAPSQTLVHRYASQIGPIPARLHPINRDDGLGHNLPATCGHEPFHTFAVVLDRPDFIDGPGVLFMLTDNEKGHSGLRKTGRDIGELHVWRSAGMNEVVKRLAMQVVMPVRRLGSCEDREGRS